jgi:hypothetical protein
MIFMVIKTFQKMNSAFLLFETPYLPEKTVAMACVRASWSQGNPNPRSDCFFIEAVESVDEVHPKRGRPLG